MNKAWITGLAAMMALTAAAQTPAPSQEQLPEAPSATVAPKPPAEPPPAQKQEPPQSRPAQSPSAPPALGPAVERPKPPQQTADEQPQQPTKNTPSDNPAGNSTNKELTEDDKGEPLQTIKKVVNEVPVIFTVTDKHGRFVKNLTKNDFKVVDDHKPAASIVSFSSETDLPLRVGLLVDASNSVRDRFRFEQEAAIEFLNQIIRPRSDRGFVIGFDTTAEVTQDFTDSAELLSRGVRMLRPGGGTALYDALYYACRDKLMKARTTGPVRRAVILLSDGEDNQSRVTREEAIEMAQRAEVIVYAISTNVSGVKLRGDKVLERLAEATGGRAFFPFKIQDVANAFSEIQDELRSQYLLAYKPADFQADGRYRTIDIVVDNKGLKVRARKGYFAGQ